MIDNVTVKDMSGFLNTTAISGSYQAEGYVGLK
jgi:hypothetical protein